ncbi:Protein of unknown function, partial [Gryllus bimaculatus]
DRLIEVLRTSLGGATRVRGGATISGRRLGGVHDIQLLRPRPRSTPDRSPPPVQPSAHTQPPCQVPHAELDISIKEKQRSAGRTARKDESSATPEGPTRQSYQRGFTVS